MKDAVEILHPLDLFGSAVCFVLFCSGLGMGFFPDEQFIGD